MGIINTEGNMDSINPLKHMLEAYNRNAYYRLGNDITVTELINSPRYVQLHKRHRDKLKSDTVDKQLPALLGTATHNIFDHNLRLYNSIYPGTYLCERRMLTAVQTTNGDIVRVAGRFDMLEKEHILWDIKQTSVYKLIKNRTSDFEEQLNLYAYMLGDDGVTVDTIKILAVFPDWKYADSLRVRYYPPSKITAYEFELWDKSEAKDKFMDRVELHANSMNVPDDELPECTKDEMWADDDVYAAYSFETAKKPRLFGTKQEAQDHIDNLKDSSTAYIKKRPGYRRRCEEWCKACNVCSQYTEYLHKKS